MARRLHLEGMEVVGVAEIKPFPGGLLRNVVQCLEDFGIPLFLRHTVARIHGQKRLSGVTLVEVDEQGQPISGTEKFFAIDTFILSVGLVPEVRPLEPFFPDGVKVNSFFQSAVPWVFFAGNALAIFDLVDTVARIGEEAGRNAARYALEKIPTPRTVPLRKGQNIAVLVPHELVPGESTHLFLRVPRPLPRATIRVAEVYAKNHVSLRPAEMVEIALPPKATAELAALPQAEVEVIPT